MGSHNGDSVTRWFQGTRRGTDHVRVNIAGVQNYDGTLAEAVIFVDGKGCYGAELSAAEARELAADLLAAADELERMEK